jgi:hypothetical protein
VKDVTQFIGVLDLTSETGALYFPQRSDQRIPMLTANLTVFVTMAIIQSWFFHMSYALLRLEKTSSNGRHHH